jgi:SAM-dependent methyltransferase
MVNRQQTIVDFGEQWTMLTENTGYYASATMLRDILEPLVDVDSLKGKSVCEIGGGTGRIVNMFLDCGAEHLTVLEPSEAFTVLQTNVAHAGDKVRCLPILGDELDAPDAFDLVCSIGVIHHIPNPAPTLQKMYESVKPGGEAFIWVYGREGNELYLLFAENIRRITKRMPHVLLRGLTHLLSVLLIIYIKLCFILPLPMRDYMKNVVGKYKYYNLFLTVFDQLNPAHAVYYTEDEAEHLLLDAGFSDVRVFHRHGYSWSVSGAKPTA